MYIRAHHLDQTQSLSFNKLGMNHVIIGHYTACCYYLHAYPKGPWAYQGLAQLWNHMSQSHVKYRVYV